MALSIGDTAPDFEAETTEGPIGFHEWLGDSWAVLFSHPRDFTPVCTTELGYMAKIKPEFDRRGVKIIGLSVDPIDNHEKWAKDIEETQGYAPTIRSSAIRTSRSQSCTGCSALRSRAIRSARTPADNQTVRNVFVIGPDKKIKLILVYPMTTGRNFDEVLRVIDSLQLTAKHKVATPVNWQQGEDVIIAGSVSDEQAKEIFGEWESPRALHPDRPAAGREGPFLSARAARDLSGTGSSAPCAFATVRVDSVRRGVYDFGDGATRTADTARVRQVRPRRPCVRARAARGRRTRGDGRRTLVHVEGIEEPLVASRSEGAIARDLAIALGQPLPRGRHEGLAGQEALF